MAIEAYYLSLLNRVRETRQSTKPRLSALFLAYPDLLVPKKALLEMVGEEVLKKIPTRSDGDQIWRYHGIPGCIEPIYDSVALFAELNINATVIDVAKLRGMEHLVDLNQPLSEEYIGKYDLVVDTGTCEHCFNVGLAFMNACEALNLGGFLMHAAPLNRFNHGFWSFNPTLYPDFFEDNGFKLHLMTGVTGDLRNGFQPFEVKPFSRFDAPPHSAIYVVAERVEMRKLIWPVQRKYRGMIA